MEENQIVSYNITYSQNGQRYFLSGIPFNSVKHLTNGLSSSLHLHRRFGDISRACHLNISSEVKLSEEESQELENVVDLHNSFSED